MYTGVYSHVMTFSILKRPADDFVEKQTLLLSPLMYIALSLVNLKASSTGG